MSLEIVRTVAAAHPDLLRENRGWTCYQHTWFLIQALRARGHSAYFISKTRGEGQYSPPGFRVHNFIGLDGKGYTCTGVSHDAIYCDGLQFDTLSGANEHDQPIYRRNGDPNWSFDPNDGPQIIAEPAWESIPKGKWRAWNPPMLIDDIPPLPPPPPPPPAPVRDVLPKGEAFAALKALNAFYQAPEGLQRPGGLVIPDSEGRSVADMEAIAQWFYQLVVERVPLEAVFAQIRASHEWRSKHP